MDRQVRRGHAEETEGGEAMKSIVEGPSAETRNGAGETVAAAKAKVAAEMAVCRQGLLVDFPFTASVMMALELVPVRDIRLATASTDGSRIFFDIGFWRAHPDERRFILAHETWHNILLHFLRRQTRDRQLFNIATDIEANGLLEREGLEIPKGGLRPDEETDGLSAEEIYEILLKRIEQAEGAMPEGRPLDKHEFAGGEGDDDATAPEAPPRDEWGEIGFDPDYGPLVLESSAETIRETALSAAARIARISGGLPAHIVRVVDALTKGEIDWRERLAAFVTSAFGGSRRWLPPSRRHVHRGLYLQSARQERLRAAVAIDTSGSTEQDASRFISELQNLLRTFGDYEIMVIQCDAAIRDVATYTPDAPFAPEGFALRGGGGTSFVPVFGHLANGEPPSILVYLTDGYGDAPHAAPPYPVLWLLTHDGVKPAEWGETAFFEKPERGGRNGN